MSLSCVPSVDHAARHTGDWVVPTPGTGMDMTLRRGLTDARKTDEWWLGHTEVLGPMETPNRYVGPGQRVAYLLTR